MPRVTIRCLREDLGQDLPPLDVELAPEHELYERLVDYAQSAPEGLDTIKSISGRKVYKIKTGRWRGASWIDRTTGLFWLLAGGKKATKGTDSPYDYFAYLDASGRLWPEDDDYVRFRNEASARFDRAAARDIRELLSSARGRPGAPHEVRLADTLPMRVCVYSSGDFEEIYVAVSLFDDSGACLGPTFAAKVFAIFELEIGEAEYEPKNDWFGEPLEWFLVARYYLSAQ